MAGYIDQYWYWDMKRQHLEMPIFSSAVLISLIPSLLAPLSPLVSLSLLVPLYSICLHLGFTQHHCVSASPPLSPLVSLSLLVPLYMPAPRFTQHHCVSASPPISISIPVLASTLVYACTSVSPSTIVSLLAHSPFTSPQSHSSTLDYASILPLLPPLSLLASFLSQHPCPCQHLASCLY